MSSKTPQPGARQALGRPAHGATGSAAPCSPLRSMAPARPGRSAAGAAAACTARRFRGPRCAANTRRLRPCSTGAGRRAALRRLEREPAPHRGKATAGCAHTGQEGAATLWRGRGGSTAGHAPWSCRLPRHGRHLVFRYAHGVRPGNPLSEHSPGGEAHSACDAGVAQQGPAELKQHARNRATQRQRSPSTAEETEPMPSEAISISSSTNA